MVDNKNSEYHAYNVINRKYTIIYLKLKFKQHSSGAGLKNSGILN